MSYEGLEEARALRGAKDKAASERSKVKRVASGKQLYSKTRRLNPRQYERTELLGAETRNIRHGEPKKHKCINIW
jgi:hypothetical protein